VPMKPVQTGAARDGAGRLRAPDLEEALAAAGLAPPDAERDELAPYRYEPACSPHLAARLAGQPIRIERIVEVATRLAARHRAVIVEGAGGVMAPLGQGRTMLDLAAALGTPALLVARAGLGTLNHVLLSLAALRGRGVPIAGVVLNEAQRPDDDSRYIRDDNARAIEEIGETRLLARVPFLPAGPEGDATLDAVLESVRIVEEPRP